MKLTAGLTLLLGLGAAGAAHACETGAYSAPGGDVLVLTTPSSGGVRYTFFDGRRGKLNEPGAPVRCEGDQVISGDSQNQIHWRKLPLRVTRTRFSSDGVQLTGELIEPEKPGKQTPLVVMAHGSENFGWVGGRVATPYLLAAKGISAFIFDKRGTGLSEGKFNMNFPRLARDLTAAAAQARAMAKGRHGQFGLHGFSQGGWVAPLAAQTVKPDFLVINYGLVLSPLEEDAAQVETELRALGYGPEVLAKAKQVTDATGALLAARFERGYEQLAQVRAAYGSEPWFRQIKGEFTGDILALDDATLRREGRARFDGDEIEWSYNPLPSLQSTTMPTLWIAAGNDREAPPELTLERLAKLREGGRDIDVAIFPRTDHGIVEFEEQPDGTRTYTNYAAGYLALLVDWSKGCISPPYGNAELLNVKSWSPTCR